MNNYNFTGTWTTEDKTKNNKTIKQDKGNYKFYQDGDIVLIHGNNNSKKWENFGIGKINSDKNEIEVDWLDTEDSCNKNNSARNHYTLEIINNDKMEQKNLSNEYAFGNFIRV